MLLLIRSGIVFVEPGMKKIESENSGFTIIESIVVLVVLSILVMLTLSIYFYFQGDVPAP